MILRDDELNFRRRFFTVLNDTNESSPSTYLAMTFVFDRSGLGNVELMLVVDDCVVAKTRGNYWEAWCDLNDVDYPFFLCEKVWTKFQLFVTNNTSIPNGFCETRAWEFRLPTAATRTTSGWELQ
jgi:hypothetical protein